MKKKSHPAKGRFSVRIVGDKKAEDSPLEKSRIFVGIVAGMTVH